MAMEITCPCGQKLLVKDEWTGGLVRCPSCQKTLTTAPSPAAAVSAAPGNPQAGERASRRASTSLVLGIIGLILHGLVTLLFMAIGQAAERRTEPEPALVILALVGVAAAVTLSILALIFGALGMKPVNTRNRGVGIAGLVLGIVGAALGSCCLGLMLFGVLAEIGRAM